MANDQKNIFLERMEEKMFQKYRDERLLPEEVLAESEARLELFFSQSLEGFFFMMLDEPVRWDDTVDKDRVLDYVFAHQRMTKVNDAMLAQYGATREQFLGLTPNDFYQHNLAHGREVWRRFFDAGRLHVETDERKLDGTPISIEGDYICFYDDDGRITGHFGIQRDVTARKRAEAALQQYNKRLKVLQDIDRAILAAHSPEEIASAVIARLQELVPCVRASVAAFDFENNIGKIIALHAKHPTKLGLGAELMLSAFGESTALHTGKVNVVADIESLAEIAELALVRGEGVRSYINVPLLAQGELIGTLNLGAEEAAAFSSSHIEIAQEAANSLAVAIRQAQLREQIEHHALALETRVQERTATLAEVNASLQDEVAVRQKAELALRDRLALEQMIGDISTRFINLAGEHLDEGINYALERMGRLVDVDRSYLFLFSADHRTARNTHEWCGPEATPQMQNLQGLNVADFAWIFPKLLRGETVYIPRVSELPAEAGMERTVFQEQAIQSLLAVPLVYKGRVQGLLGFDAVRAEKVWIEEDVRLLNVVGEIIMQSLHRKQVAEALRASEARLQRIFASAMDAIIIIDETMHAVMCNAAAEKVFRCSSAEVKSKRFDPFLSENFRAILANYIQSATTQTAPQYLWAPEGLTARRSDGETFPLEATISRFEISQQNLFTIILRDINERKQAEEEMARLQTQNVYLREEALKSEYNFGEIIGASEAMQKIYANLKMVAATDATVLLLGETGTGKELIARTIHNLSGRKEQVMVKVNCGALPAGLVESELFGHEKGAFTGATALKKGRFELAHRGTIFLDEVGELPLDTQVKLLRVLQEQEFERVGGAQTLKVNVRVIAATNRNLQEQVQRGAFRADLFYRLNIFPLEIPPLRERSADIALLANYFVREFARRFGKRITSISQKALDKLTSYNWPGNVRELANILERAVILCQGRALQEEHIGIFSVTPAMTDAVEKFETLEEAERRHILSALAKTNGVVAGPNGAAQLLGMNRSTLWSRMRKLGMETKDASSGNIAK
jgi:PAS domain S-box-containing protein